ncbi:MAG: cation transporter [Treponema sp.]|nr:cation transporter [Treponema sp.]
MNTKNRARIIRTAGYIALFGNLVLATVKLILANIAGSLAVTGDGIDSLTDVAIASMTLVVSHIITRPGDKKHPWGYGRTETTATMALSFVIFFAGSQVVVSSIRQLVLHTYQNEVSFYAIVAALISIAGKSLLAISQYVLGKKSNSPMIQANAQNMKGDILLSAGVLLGIAVARFLHKPIFDPLTALLVGTWVIKNAIEIFSDTNTELMDGNTNEEMYRRMFDAVRSVQGVSHPHRARIRKIASRWDIDLDIEVDANMTVYEAHEIANNVEKAVHAAISDIYDIMVHIEPAGRAVQDTDEQYGVTETDVQ